jgi:hypothetical protein
VSGFTAAWTHIQEFFTSVWTKITGVVMTVANWFGSVWGAVTGAFAAAWTWVSDLFVSVWDGIKGVVMGFAERLLPVIDIILAPFRFLGKVIGGIIEAVSGAWLGEAVNAGNAAVAGMNLNGNSGAKELETGREALSAAKAAMPVAKAAVPPAAPAVTVPNIAPPALDAGQGSPDFLSMLTQPALTTATATAIAPPETGATASPVDAMPQFGTETPVPTATDTSGSKNALAAEHMAAAMRKRIDGAEISYAASAAFTGGEWKPSAPATLAPAAFDMALTPAIPALDGAGIREETARFGEATGRRKDSVIEMPRREPEKRNEKAANRVIHIENLTLSGDDIFQLANFVRQLEQAVDGPLGVEA